MTAPVLRFATVFFTAVAMAAALAHLFVLPHTISLDRSTYLTVQQIYRGWSLLGFVVVAALACAALQTLSLGKDDARGRRLSLAATVCIAAALADFFVLVLPVNLRTDNWTQAPADWQALRARWEAGHALGALLYAVAFSALVLALLPHAARAALHEEAEVLIHAPPAQVAALYRDFSGWPRLFPATIRGVRLVRREPQRVTVEVDHRQGTVVNVMSDLSPGRIALWESKRRYDATFVNSFEPAPIGTRYHVTADVELKGPARWLAPFLHRYIRRQIQHYVLEPMRRAAEQKTG